MPLQPLKLLTDQAIGENTDGREDGLGFTDYARTLAGTALGTEGPFTIGIFGDWGTGKTSLMRMIQREFADDEEVLTVWFEAWRYGREDHPIIPLVATIIREIKDQTDNNTKSGKFSKVLNALRALVYGVSLKVTVPGIEAEISTKDMIDRDNQLSEEQKQTADNLAVDSLYYNAYEAPEQLKPEDDQGKIVVFIDDLDRCLPDVAVQLLESIKLVLSQAGFIFVLGMSRPIIDGYLNKRYQEDFGLTDFIGRDYLDKIIQLAFYIPPHHERIDEFAKSILSVLKDDDKEHLVDIIPLISIASGHNPRVTIRFINNLLVDKSIRPDIPIGYFAITRSLQHYWLDVLEILVEQSTNTLHIQISNWLEDGIPTFDDNSTVEAKLAIKLSGSPQLVALLETPQGKEWLYNQNQRKAAVQLLRVPAYFDIPADQMLSLMNKAAAKYAISANISRQEVEDLIKEFKSKPKSQTPERFLDLIEKFFVEKLSSLNISG